MNKNKTHSSGVIDKIYQHRYIAWIVGLYLLSFCYHNASLEPFINFRFLIHIGLITLYTILFFGVNRKKEIWIKSKTTIIFFIAGLLFALWTVVSSFFSISFYESLFPIAQVFIFGLSVFYIMESLSEKKALHTSFKAFTILVFIHALIGIFQVSDLGFTELPGGWTPNGLMGHRNLFGGFLAASLCFPAYMAIQSKSWWRWFSAGVVFVVLLGIIYSQTRTAWLSAFASILLIPIGLYIIEGAANSKKILKLSGISLVVLVMVVATTFFANKDLRQSIGRRLEAMIEMDINGPEVDEAVGSLQFRVRTWKQTLQIAFDHPVTGVGPDNWKIMIPLYGSGGYQVDSGLATRVQPHNIYLKVLSETGFFGLLFFLTFLGVILFSAIKLIFDRQLKSDKTLLLFLLIGFISFLIDMLSSFSVSRIEHSFLLAFLIGAILSIIEKNSRQGKNILLNKFILIATSSLILIYSLFIGLVKFEFGKTMKEIRFADSQNNYQSVIKIAETGKSKWVKLDHLTIPIESYTAIAYRKMGDFKKAEAEMQTAMQYHPNSARNLNGYGAIFLEQRRFKEALPYLNRALKLTPHNTDIKKNLSLCYYFTEDYERVIDILQTFDSQQEENYKNMYQNSLNKVYREGFRKSKIE